MDSHVRKCNDNVKFVFPHNYYIDMLRACIITPLNVYVKLHENCKRVKSTIQTEASIACNDEHTVVEERKRQLKIIALAARQRHIE